jgi:hypothetical protein
MKTQRLRNAREPCWHGLVADEGSHAPDGCNKFHGFSQISFGCRSLIGKNKTLYECQLIRKINTEVKTVCDADHKSSNFLQENFIVQ